MRAPNDIIFDAVAVSGTDVYNSEAIPADQLFEATCQAVTTGSNPNGALKAQFSNDNPTTGAPVSWSDITSATVSTTNNGTYAVQKFTFAAMFIRFVFTNASGSGVLTARFKGNGV